MSDAAAHPLSVHEQHLESTLPTASDSQQHSQATYPSLGATTTHQWSQQYLGKNTRRNVDPPCYQRPVFDLYGTASHGHGGRSLQQLWALAATLLMEDCSWSAVEGQQRWRSSTTSKLPKMACLCQVAGHGVGIKKSSSDKIIKGVQIVLSLCVHSWRDDDTMGLDCINQVTMNHWEINKWNWDFQHWHKACVWIKKVPYSFQQKALFKKWDYLRILEIVLFLVDCLLSRWLTYFQKPFGEIVHYWGWSHHCDWSSSWGSGGTFCSSSAQWAFALWVSMPTMRGLEDSLLLSVAIFMVKALLSRECCYNCLLQTNWMLYQHSLP